MEKGATHYTHWFQPLTGSTAEKHDSFYAPDGRGHGDRRLLRQGADPGRARRLLVPDRRHPRHLRGPRLHRLGPDDARPSSSRTPTAPSSASRRPSRRGPARRWTTRSRCCARWTRCRKSAIRALRLFGDDAAQRVFTTVGPEQEYFLIDEQYYFERPDLINTGRTLFGAKPPKGHELDDHYFGSIPERDPGLHARRASASWPSSACRSRPATTRSPRTSTRWRRSSRTRNVGSDHQQLTMQMHAERGPPLRPRVPAAREALRRRQRLGQAQQLVDGHRHGQQPARAGRHAAREPRSSCSSARPSSRPSTSTRRCCAPRSPRRARTTGWAPTRRRRRSSRSSSAPSCSKAFGAIESGKGDAATDEGLPRPGHRGAPAAAHARRRPQPHLARSPSPATSSSSARSARQHVAGAAQHGAQHDRRRGARRARRRSSRGSSRAAARSRTRCRRSSRTARPTTSRSSSTATTTPRSGTRRPRSAGCTTSRTTPDALPWLVEEQTVGVFSDYGVLSERELALALRGVRRAVRDQAEHRGRDGGRDRPDDAAARGGPPPGQLKAAERRVA